MNTREAYAQLKRIGVPAIETAEAAALLRQSKSAASQTLARLAQSGLVTRVRSGTWWIDGPVQREKLAPFLCAPFPGYVSLASALRAHGMIEQIPSVTYVVTLGRSRRIPTSAGSFSLHYIDPVLFGGFEQRGGALVATPEKALFDLAYLAGGRSRLGVGVPELTLPRRFKKRELEQWVERIPSQRARTLTEARLAKLMKSARSSLSRQ
jgi:predicted transcriptional regulator of viral defense system